MPQIGFPLSFGVFQEYYSRVPEFAGNRYISVVGTIASGFGYLGAPVVMPFIQRYPWWQRQMIWVGCTCGLIDCRYSIIWLANLYHRANLHSRTGPRIFCFYFRGPYPHARCGLRSRLSDILLSYSQHG